MIGRGRLDGEDWTGKIGRRRLGGEDWTARTGRYGRTRKYGKMFQAPRKRGCLEHFYREDVAGLFLAAVCCGAVTLLAALVLLVAACTLRRVAALLLAIVFLIAISTALCGCLLSIL